MSTKIWTAYRLKPGNDPWAAFMRLKREGQARARKELWDFYVLLAASAPDNDVLRAALKIEESKLPGPLMCSTYVRNQYAERLGKMERHPFCLDTAIGVRRIKGRYYLIPATNGLMHSVLDALAEDPSLEDYHYQNQCDRPEHIDPRQWNRRRVTWEIAFKDWQAFMAIDVVSFDGFGEVCPAMHPDYLNWGAKDRDSRMEKWDTEVAAKRAEIVKTQEAAAS